MRTLPVPRQLDSRAHPDSDYGGKKANGAAAAIRFREQHDEHQIEDVGPGAKELHSRQNLTEATNGIA